MSDTLREGADMTKRMNPEVKSQWQAALRSGKYKQITDALRRDGGFCCLGVLCDLAPPEAGHWSDRAQTPRGFKEGRRLFESGGATHVTGLPQAVQDWAGLDSADGSYPVGGGLAHRNDYGTTFDEIADIIEREF